MTKSQNDSCRRCRIIEELNSQIQDLQSENRKLGSTVDWMHQMIWDLLARNQSLVRQMEAITEEEDLQESRPTAARPADGRFSRMPDK